MVNEFKSPFAFIIDTDSYAGNFERELCAYITGHIGDCGVGEVNAARFKDEVGEPFENVTVEADDHGCCRPVTICPTPGWFNDGMGSHYEEGVDLDCVIPFGFKCVYTVEKHPSGWYKHTSVSVQNPNEARPYPSVEGIREIIKMFGYTQQLEECMVWEEKPY